VDEWVVVSVVVFDVDCVVVMDEDAEVVSEDECEAVALDDCVDVAEDDLDEVSVLVSDDVTVVDGDVTEHFMKVPSTNPVSASLNEPTCAKHSSRQPLLHPGLAVT